MAKLGLNDAIAFSRISPGTGPTRTTRLAAEIDQSAVGNKDKKISLSEVDAFVAQTTTQLANERAIAQANPNAWNAPQISDLSWNLEGAKMLRGQLADREASSAAGDAVAGFGKRLGNVLLWPLGKLLGSGNTPNFNTET